MNARSIVIRILLFSLVVTASLGLAAVDAAPVAAGGLNVPAPVPTDPPSDPPPDPPIPPDWWSIVQEDIRRSEYHVTWQDTTYLPDLPAAYQAPNRAQGLRTYFAPSGVRVIPRTDVTPSWEWGLALTEVGVAGDVRPVEDAALYARDNRIELRRGEVTEAYVNEERGLGQSLTLHAPPSPASLSTGALVLRLTLTGDLIPSPSTDGSAVAFATRGGARVLRYGGLSATDARGRHLDARLAVRDAQLVIQIDAASAAYPIVVGATVTGLSHAVPTGLNTSPDWSVVGGDAGEELGHAVSTAGDVNDDGYSDVIVGVPYYDGGSTDEGAAFVYHGSPSGLSTTADWTAEVNQAYAEFGHAVSLAGDVNGDGYSDVVVGAYKYQFGPETDEGAVFFYPGSLSGLGSYYAILGEQEGAHFGESVGTAGDVDGDGYSDIIVGEPSYDVTGTTVVTNAGRVLVYYGSVSGPSLVGPWSVEGDEVNLFFGKSVATAGDVNADGYADVIVGSPNYTDDQDAEGQALVYRGSSSGPSATPDWTADGDQAHSSFGTSVSTAGDVNGDGYTDVIVGASSYDHGELNEGRAFVYHGSSTGLNASAAWTAESDQALAAFGRAVSTAGDVNGDGYADVIVGAPYYNGTQPDEGAASVYTGSAGGLHASAAWMVGCGTDEAQFGDAVGTAGDVNGDGYSDVIVGAPGYGERLGDDDVGQATVYHGSASGLGTTPGWTAESDDPATEFGHSVATAGDVNGDGYADVVVGARYYDNGHPNEGGAWVYHGTPAGLSSSASWSAEGGATYAYFGQAVSTAGDVNGDGYSDLIVGASGASNGETGEGVAYVYHGSAAGLSTSADWMAEGDQVYAEFGYAASTAGDVNGDGYADVIVGAHMVSNGHAFEGKAFVYHGSSAGLSTDYDWTVESDQGYAEFGAAVSTAGDVNGDGYADVIVGAYMYDGGEEDEGQVVVYHGSPGGLSAAPDWAAEGDLEHVWFGSAVSTAGDVNGDGYSDVIVGAQSYDGGETNEGRATVYHGSPTGLNALADWVFEGEQAHAWCGYSVSTAGDVNGDGYADVVVGVPNYDGDQLNEGQALVFHGSAAGLAGTPDWAVESDHLNFTLGHAVSTAGDVNGDGYADVVVGLPGYDNGEVDEGAAYLYYGNEGPGLALQPRQRQVYGSVPLALWGMTDEPERVQLCMMRRMPMGRERVKFQWQVAPLGTPFTATSIVSGTLSGWSNTGSVLCLNLSGLTPGTPYHWRMRTLYRASNPMGQPASRWVHVPWNGWNEQDFRTLYLTVYLPLVLRGQ
jgi:hypothetical protein